VSPAAGVFLLLAVAVMAFVLAPLFRREAKEEERRASAASEMQELRSRREMALSALKDLEDDKATGKIGDEDYQDLKAKLTLEAVELMKRLDGLKDAGTPYFGKRRGGSKGRH